METKINAIHFDISEKLTSFINKTLKSAQNIYTCNIRYSHNRYKEK